MGCTIDGRWLCQKIGDFSNPEKNPRTAVQFADFKGANGYPLVN